MDSNPPADERDRVERFIAAYNSIDRELRHRMGAKSHVPFAALAREYGAKHQFWPDSRQLLILADLRNFVVHTKTEPHKYLAVPAIETVEAIEGIRHRLHERVIPRFQRTVTTVQLTDSLADVLALVNEREFSQFPAYDEAGNYQGLLTENGIARWLASYAVHKETIIEFEDVCVVDLLDKEEARPNCAFCSRNEAVHVVFSKFGQNPQLEAVLVTTSGKSSGTPIGIVTVWDVSRPT